MTLWASIKNSRKAIVAGAAAALAFIAATLQDHPDHDLTLRQWLEAAAVYAAAHITVWLLPGPTPPPPAAVTPPPTQVPLIDRPAYIDIDPQKPAEPWHGVMGP